MRRLFLALAIVATSMFAFAGEGESTKSEALMSVSGQIVDEVSGEALVGVAVDLNGETVYTDFDGNFEFKVKPGKYSIGTKYVAYEQKTVEVKIDSKEEVNIKLKSL